MPVSLEDVDHIALLARLGLTDDERSALRGELEAILGYVEQLSAVDTSNVEATASTVDTPAPVRPDRVENEDQAEQLVAGARARAARGAALQQSVNRFQVEIHKKLAIAIACLVFVLMGPPLALRFPSAGVGFVVVASGVIFFVYYVGLLGGEAQQNRSRQRPAFEIETAVSVSRNQAPRFSLPRLDGQRAEIGRRETHAGPVGGLPRYAVFSSEHRA